MTDPPATPSRRTTSPSGPGANKPELDFTLELSQPNAATLRVEMTLAAPAQRCRRPARRRALAHAFPGPLRRRRRRGVLPAVLRRCGSAGGTAPRTFFAGSGTAATGRARQRLRDHHGGELQDRAVPERNVVTTGGVGGNVITSTFRSGRLRAGPADQRQPSSTTSRRSAAAAATSGPRLRTSTPTSTRRALSTLAVTGEPPPPPPPEGGCKVTGGARSRAPTRRGYLRAKPA